MKKMKRVLDLEGTKIYLCIWWKCMCVFRDQQHPDGQGVVHCRVIVGPILHGGGLQ